MHKKICLAVLVMLICISSAFADQHENNFELFEETIIEAANKITWSGEHNFQDVEFVENEMDGDETVYARAWYDDYYVVVRKYEDKNWSSSYVASFWTASEELTFLNGIKVGSSIDDVKKFFGKDHVWQPSQSSNKYEVYRVEESSVAGRITFFTKNNRITSIAYTNWYNMTSKMIFLHSLYASSAFAEITGDKVNVREYSGYEKGKDKVKFQVSKSKGDSLLIDPESYDGWCDVIGRLVNNSLKSTPYCYISKQFLKIRDLTPSERKLYFSQITSLSIN